MTSLPTVDGAIASVIAAQQSAVASQIDFAVAAKGLDAAAQQGEAAVALLESAAKLSKGIGVGKAFDAQG